MWNRIKNWIEIRIGLDDLVRTQLKEYSVPRNINIFYTLGVVALAAYIIQAVTGFFLLVYYIPHPDHAFRSVQGIMTVVPYGWLFRMVHIVGSNLMVAVVFLHLFSVFFMGSYKKPRNDMGCGWLNVTRSSHILSQWLSASMESAKLLGDNHCHFYANSFPLCR